MSSNASTSAGPKLTTPSIARFYPRVRLAQYVAKFEKDPLTFLNANLLRDECEWVESGAGYVLAKKRQNLTDPIEPAEIRIIGEVSASSYWLHPCGGWNGNFDEQLAKAKASGRLRPGRAPEVEHLWQRFLEVIDDVVSSRGPPTRGRNFSLIERGEIKIRHKIFESVFAPLQTSTPVRDAVFHAPAKRAETRDVATSTQDDGGVSFPVIGELEQRANIHDSNEFVDVASELDDVASTISDGEETIFVRDSSELGSVAATEDNVDHVTGDTSDDELSAAFDMVNWPCRTERVKKELDALIASKCYIGHPLPVFDFNGKRIPPIDHEKKLRGALVDVAVKITHVTYKQFSFFADIVSIIILAPPGYEPTVEEAVTKRKRTKYSKPKFLQDFIADFDEEDE